MRARNAYIQGAGRLEFKATSPSGLGRQVLIPFYLESQVDNFQVLTPSGLQNTSTSSPKCAYYTSSKWSNKYCNTKNTPNILVYIENGWICY